MAVERRSPLPAGAYWLDVFGDDRAKFAAWRRANAASVRVVASESFDTSPPRDWVKFVVSAPVAWDALEYGFPTVIPAGAKVDSSDDTVTKPPPEKDPLDKLDDALGSAGRVSSDLVLAVAAGVGVIVLVNVWTATRGLR